MFERTREQSYEIREYKRIVPFFSGEKVWMSEKSLVSLQRQNENSGYPGKFPAREQDFIDTTPF